MDPTGSSAPGDAEIDLLPVRMLNEFVYCPRLFHFMHVAGRSFRVQLQAAPVEAPRPRSDRARAPAGSRIR